jgi:flagellar hook-associated protein 1 FlgK
MANILASLGAAASNLGVFGQALAVTQNNIGNAATPGYARQRILLEALPFNGNGGQPGGVAVSQVESIRDRFLDSQVISAFQKSSYFDNLSQTLNQIESHLPLTGDSSPGSAIDQLWNAFSALSVAPGDFNLRQAVLQAAQRTADAVHAAYAGFSSQSAGLDQQARAAVDQINSLAAEIAKLNAARAQGGAGAGGGAVETRLSRVLEQLAGLADYRIVYQQDGALSIVLNGGAALVSGESSFPLKAYPTASRLEILDSQGNDVAGAIPGGQLGSILTARNTNIAGYIGRLNQLAGALADAVNEQLAAGHDLSGVAGKPLFQYTSLAFTGSGRTPGTLGGATPSPPDGVTVQFSGGLGGSITANLDSFFVAAAPPSGLATGDTITVQFTSADRATQASIVTAPLTAGDTTAVIAARLNDQVALHPELAGKITFRDENGKLKIVESDTVGQGFTFTASAGRPGFTSGLESGGKIGGESAKEIADALNAQIALNPALSAAGVRFTTSGGVAGQVRVDADLQFNADVTDSAAGTGFVSGLAGTFTAGGSPAAATLALTGLANREIAASGPGSATGNENALAMAQLASSPVVGGFTLNQFYAQLVSQAGEDGRQAQASAQTQKQVLLQAQNLRDAFSGVSLDEEAAQLIEFQKAYEATARVITVLSSLADTVMGLIGRTAAP